VDNIIHKVALILAIISLASVIGLTATKFLNIHNMEINDPDASSYHDMSVAVYIIIGVLMMISGYLTWKVSRHISAFILPFGLGLTLFFYGVYIACAKGMIA